MHAWIREYPGVDEVLHECIVNYTHVYCNYLWCSYDEYFETVEDAECAAEVHENDMRSLSIE